MNSKCIPHPKAYDRLRSGWQGLFRETILQLMPVEGIEDNFSKTIGQPTKELLLHVRAYFYHGVYGLNLDSTDIYLSERTIYRYKALLIKNELAGSGSGVYINSINFSLNEQWGESG